MKDTLFKYAWAATIMAGIMLIAAYCGPWETSDAGAIHLFLSIYCGIVISTWILLLLLKLSEPEVGDARVVLLQSKLDMNIDGHVIREGTCGFLKRYHTHDILLFHTDIGQVTEVKEHEIARL